MVEYLSGNRIQGSSTSGATDGIGSAGDLTLSGTTSYATGLVGKCIYADFSGTEGQQGTPAGNFFSQARTNNNDFNFIHTAGEAWTINLWVKPTVAENGAIQQLIGNESYTGSSLSGFNIKILDRSASSEVRRVSTDFKNDGNVIYSAYNGTDGDMPNNTNWSMITVRCNGATTSGATALDICINGGTSNNDFSTPNGTCTRSSSTATARNATYGLMFGRNLLKRWGSTNAYADPFDGSFDEVSIWNRELTDAECVALYNSGSGAVTTTAVTNLSKLIAYWNFNDNVTNQASPTDEKTTLADATVTTSTTPTFSDDFTTNNWLEQDDTYIGVDTSTERLDFDMRRNSIWAGATYDLTSTSDTKWVLRYKFNLSTNTADSGAIWWTGLTEHPSSTNINGSGNGIVLRWQNQSTNKWFQLDGGATTQNEQYGTSATLGTYSTGTDYFVEIVRDNNSVTATARSGSYTGSVINTQTRTYPSGTTSLRYVQISNYGGDTAGSAGLIGYIDELKFYNGVTAVTSTTTSLAPPVNTRYEEVDTRKIYRWADSTDKTNICNYWKMDSSTNTDTATTANGYTNGLGKNGTNSNITVDTSDKKIGTASYEFNGASSSTSKCTYGSASDWKFLHNGDDWSATFWAKLDSLSGGGEILSTMTGNNGGETGMHFYLHPDGGGEFTMQMFNGSGAPFPINSTVSSVFTTGTWNHYAVTFNGTTVTVYKDGVLKGTITKGSAGLGSGNPTYTLHMGDAGDGAVGELDGKLDDFAIWKTVLSASFIKTLYEASATDNITGWKERGSA